LLVALQDAVVGQGAAADAPDQREFRTWTDRSGRHRTEASFVESKDGRVVLRKKNGATIDVLFESLSDADQKYLRTLGKKPPGENPGDMQGSTGMAKRRGDKASTAVLQAKEVVVTGLGTDPDKAVQNAFSQAIEQTVGLLVDAETVVKNDQLIRDEILTYSRGYMEKYEVVKRWQEDGLHHAKIRAVVARDKLVEKLGGIKVAVQKIDGDGAARQIEFDVKNEEQVAEMLKKAVAGFDMAKLTKVEIVGQPEITRDDANATLTVSVKVSADANRWKEFSRDLRTILAKSATRRVTVTSTGNDGWYDYDGKTERQLDGKGVLVALVTPTNIDGDRLQWEVFRVPAGIQETIKSCLGDLGYRLVIALLDDKDTEVARTSENLHVNTWGLYPIWGDGRAIGPVWQRESGGVWPVLRMKSSLSLSVTDLSKVAKTVAFLEGDTEKR
jgi:hypothetical protein